MAGLDVAPHEVRVVVAETSDVDLSHAAFDHGDLDCPLAHLLSGDIGAGQDVATLPIEGRDAGRQTLDLGESQLCPRPEARSAWIWSSRKTLTPVTTKRLDADTGDGI